MNNFLVLGISLAIISGPIAFAAFMLGYRRGTEDRDILYDHFMDRPQTPPIPVHGMMVDLPDDPDEYRVIVTHGDKRTVI